ncbi:LysM peptidoglycan-binding domain-containing protein [Paenibacillus konkukensis]|nr:LysM peptidoglycan-binding domain-containing protein [Paenibacillus konkukensis]
MMENNHKHSAVESLTEEKALLSDQSRTVLHAKKKSRRLYTVVSVLLGTAIVGGAIAMVSAESGLTKTEAAEQAPVKTGTKTLAGSSLAYAASAESEQPGTADYQPTRVQAEADAADVQTVGSAQEAGSTVRSAEGGSKSSAVVRDLSQAKPKQVQSDKPAKDTVVTEGASGNKSKEAKSKSAEKAAPASPSPSPSPSSSLQAPLKAEGLSKESLQTSDTAKADNPGSADNAEKTDSASKSDKAVQLPASYIVKAGDTLFSLSVQFYRSPQYVSLIADSNHIKKTADLKAGDKLTIPQLPIEKTIKLPDYDFSVHDHTVKKGETLSSISKEYYQSAKHASFIASFNHLDENNPLKEGSVLKIPLSSAIDYN